MDHANQHDDAASGGRVARGAGLRVTLGWGARLGLVALLVWTGTALNLPYGPVADVAAGLLLGLALLGLGELALSLLRWVAIGWLAFLGRMLLVATLGAAAFLIGFASVPPPLALLTWAVWLGIGVAVAVAAASLRRWVRVDPRSGSRPRLLVAAVAALLAAVALVAFWWWPGAPDPVPVLTGEGVTPLDLPDPGEAGPLPVASLRYGSGAHAWRDLYGRAADVRTTPVDLADLVQIGGLARSARRLALGFDLDAVPRNATVWFPAAAGGPYPLVLVAHGNANLFVPSELGYAWLGEHLASHGFVVASIDAAAFNALPVVGSLHGENAARALLILAHLDLWRGWEEAAEPALPRVDLDRVALLGHSRGGEAAAIAATLDRIGRLPANALEPLSERVGGPHGVRAVVAIAPSDGQYRPGDRPTALQGVDYLVLQGGHDADVSSFVGERQYERAEPAADGFKAAVYLHHANHGQFNDAWGRYDMPVPLSTLQRTGAIMPAAEQQRAGAALIGAFLRASLLGEAAYREAFRDPRGAAAWLPDTAVVSRYQAGDGGVRLLGYDDEVQPTAGSLPGSVVEAEGLALWREGDPNYRRGVRRDATAVTLGWRTVEDGPAPAYRLRLPLALAELAPDPAAIWLTLEVARGTTPLPGDAAAPTGPLDAHLVVVDEAGEQARLPLSAGVGVPPPLPSMVSRLPALALPRHQPAAYPLYQRVDLPLAELLAANPDLDPARAFELALVFDAVPEGVIVVRSLALSQPSPPPP